MPESYKLARSEQMRVDAARWERERQDRADAVAAVEAFNSRLSSKKEVWAWPTIGAALTSKFIWLVVACDSCGLMLDMDLTMKRRDPNVSIRASQSDHWPSPLSV
jgi:hypothetical protein